MRKRAHLAFLPSLRFLSPSVYDSPTSPATVLSAFTAASGASALASAHPSAASGGRAPAPAAAAAARPVWARAISRGQVKWE